MTTSMERGEARVTFGDLLKRARLDAGMEQAELATKIGASRASVGAWERDRNQPDFGVVRRIVAATGATWLYTEPFRDEDGRSIGWCTEPAGQTLISACA